MASAEREPVTGVWGRAEFRGRAPGQRIRGKAPEAKSFEASGRLKEGPKFCCQYAKTV